MCHKVARSCWLAHAAKLDCENEAVLCFFFPSVRGCVELAGEDRP